MGKTKSYNIPKKAIHDAWIAVKKNQGTYGVDQQSIQEFEKDLKKNLYKLWNRMCSGTYFPSPVRAVLIPKANGKMRQLGIPTVMDRIAQAVVKLHLEPKVDPLFHEDSYGFRPARSALMAVEVARERCWTKQWVIDLDMKNFFDELSHELILKAVKAHSDEKWVSLYIERWLKSPIQEEGQSPKERMKGTPQGGVISPLLANLFMHYAFDLWMKRMHPNILFERYADDIIIHCDSRRQAENMLQAIQTRLRHCQLELNVEKTRIVYCRSYRHKQKHPNIQFDFLGFTFRPRMCKGKTNNLFLGFNPGISKKAAINIRREIRHLKLSRQTYKSLNEIAQICNQKVRGWVNYYGKFYKTALYPTLNQLERALINWVRKKYKRFRRNQYQAACWLGRIARREPDLFVHWQFGVRSMVG